MRLPDRGLARSAARWAICLLVVMGGAAIARPQDDATKNEIQACLDRGYKALAAKDLDAYCKELCAADYRYTDYFGEVCDRDKAMTDMRILVDHADDINAKPVITSIKMNGDQAIVVCRTKGTATTKDPDGKSLPVRWDDREVQVWMKTSDGWRMRDNMGLTQSVFIGDKPWTPETRDEEAAARTFIQSAYNAITRAIVAGQREELAKLLPGEFVVFPVDAARAQNRDGYVTAILTQFEKEPATAEFKLERAKISGDTAVVLGTLKSVCTKPANGSDKVVSTWYHRDVWKKTDDGWKPAEFHPIYREWSIGGKDQSAIYITPGTRS